MNTFDDQIKTLLRDLAFQCAALSRTGTNAMTNNVYANQADELEMGRPRRTGEPEFFWLPAPGGTGHEGAWFWRDDDCDEPIGPFPTEVEAVADYEELRQ